MRHMSLIAALLLVLMTGVGSAAWPWPPPAGPREAPPFPQPPPFPQAPPFPSLPPFPPDRTSPYRAYPDDPRYDVYPDDPRYRAYPDDPRYRDPRPDRFTIRKGKKCEVHCERIGRSRDYRCTEYRC